MSWLEVYIEKPPAESEHGFEIEGVGSIQGKVDYADDSLVRVSLS